jgi:hypothetical protein
MAQHHEFGGSRLPYLDDCRAFESRPSDDNESAQEGTELHDYAQKAVEAYMSKEIEKDKLCLHAQTAMRRDGYEEDQIEAVNFCLYEVQDILKNYNVVEIWTEEYLTIKEPNGKVVNFGSGDLILIVQAEKGKFAFLIDYKFGRVKVKPAPVNLQGHSYAVALMQMAEDVDHVVIKFLQPRIYYKTDVTIYRGEIADYYDKIITIIDQASMQERPRTPNKACAYCKHAGTCGALANVTAKASAGDDLPMPISFQSTELTQPEEIAKAWWCMKRIDDMRDALKGKVHELAEAGADLSFNYHEQYISFHVSTFPARRELGDAVLIHDALKDSLSAPQILSCCDLKISRLEELYGTVAVERYKKRRAQTEKLIKDTKELRKRAKAKNDGAGMAKADAELVRLNEDLRMLKENRVTKKSSKEQMYQTLEMEGLVSRSEVPVKRINMHVTDIATNALDID